MNYSSRTGLIAAWLTTPGDSTAGMPFLNAAGLLMLFDPSQLGSAEILLWLVALILAAYGVTCLVRLGWCLVGRTTGTFSIEAYGKFVWLPWRPVVWQILRLQGWWMERQYGHKATAGFASPLLCMTLLYRSGMIYLGRLRLFGFGFFMPCGIKARGASVLLGQARSGKSAHLISRLISAVKALINVFVFDTDGTFTRVLAKLFTYISRSRFFCLDPLGMVKDLLTSACYNVMVDMAKAVQRAGPENAEAEAVRWATKIVEALITDDNQMQPFFAQSSRAFCRALLLYVFYREPRKSLVRFRELLALGLHDRVKPGENAHDLLFFEMKECGSAFGGIIAQGGELAIQSKTREGRNNATSTALSQTAWLSDPDIVRISERSDFSFEELKMGTLTVTLCAPTSEMKHRLAPWFRVLLTASLYTAETIPGRGKRRSLYALDEFCAIGRVPLLELVPAVYPKYGVTGIFVAQEIPQIKSTYKDSWETFLSNSDSVLWLGTESEQTLDYLHKKLGTCTRREKIAPPKFSEGKPRYEMRERPVMLPDDLRRFLDPEKKNAIVTRTGARPLKLKNGVYFRENAVWEYSPDPEYKERLLRPWARKCVEAFLAWHDAQKISVAGAQRPHEPSGPVPITPAHTK